MFDFNQPVSVNGVITGPEYVFTNKTRPKSEIKETIIIRGKSSTNVTVYGLADEQEKSN